jgi:hypothetical protein
LLSIVIGSVVVLLLVRLIEIVGSEIVISVILVVFVMVTRCISVVEIVCLVE